MVKGRALSPDFVRTVHRLQQRGKLIKEIASTAGKSEAWVHYVLKNFDSATGQSNNVAKRGRKRISGLEDGEILEKAFSINPHITMRALCGQLEEKHATTAHWTTVHRRTMEIYRNVSEVSDELTDKHKSDRVKWCRDMLEKLNKDPGLFDYCFFSDEASLDLDCRRQKVND